MSDTTQKGVYRPQLSNRVNGSALSWTGLALSVIVAASVAPWTRNFLPNFLAYWLPILTVLILILLFKARPAAIMAAATTLCIYLIAFHAWVASLSHPDGLVWLFYLLSFPGAAIGAISAEFWLRSHKHWPATLAGCFVAAAIVSGIAANHVILRLVS